MRCECTQARREARRETLLEVDVRLNALAAEYRKWSAEADAEGMLVTVDEVQDQLSGVMRAIRAVRELR